MKMTKRHEKLLIATLAGLVITAAAAFAMSPAFAVNAPVTKVIVVASR
jgi:hypothetical protein